MPEENLYELLQVQPTADAEIIQAAFRRLILRFHPDRSPAPNAQEMTQRLNHAYEILSDPRKRADYDRELLLNAGRAVRSTGQEARRPSSRPPPKAPQSPPPGPRSSTEDIRGFPRWVWLAGAGIVVAIVAIVALNAEGTSTGRSSGDGVPFAGPLPTSTPVPNLASLPTPSPMPTLVPSLTVSATPTPSPTSTPIAHYDNGAAFYESKQYSQAIIEFTSAILLNPNYSDAYNYRGVAYQEIGRLEQAIEDYDKAIQLNPDDSLAFNNRGTAYLELGQTQEALLDYDKAIQLDPGFPLASVPRSPNATLEPPILSVGANATPGLTPEPPVPSVSSNLTFFTIGSTKDEVLSLHGSPPSFNDNNWYYTNGNVSFSGGLVTTWTGDMKARIVPSGP